MVVVANDSDVVVICISLYAQLAGSELWVDFGSGKHRRYIAIHEIASQLGVDKSSAHFCTRSVDMTQYLHFVILGKKTVWDTWAVFPEITSLFIELAKLPTNVTTEMVSLIQRFVGLLYKRMSLIKDVNTARGHLFSSANRQINNIPPTAAALEQHLRRAIMQCHV